MLLYNLLIFGNYMNLINGIFESCYETSVLVKESQANAETLENKTLQYGNNENI